MTVASSSIELDEFEQVEAAPGTALLRVAARPSAGFASQEAATLVVDDGVRRHRLSPLPAPPGPTGLLRAAYSAPLELLNGRTAFTLELPDGSVVDLPAPTTRERLVHGEPSERPGGTTAASRLRQATHAEVLHERRLRDEAERHAESRRLAIDELERRLQAERDRRASSEAQMANAAAAEAEAIRRLAELEVEQQAAIAELADAIEDTQERLLTAGRAFAEERARAAAELEQARAATAQAEARATETERSQLLLALELESQRAELERDHAALQRQIADVERARADLGAAHEAALRREEALNEAEREAEVAAAEHATELERLEQAVRMESERSAQLSERVGRLVAELAALAAARTGAEEAAEQLRDELETALAQRACAEAEVKAQRAAARETKLEAVRLAAEARAQAQAEAEVAAAMRARPKTRAAEPPQSMEQAAADVELPRRVRDRETAPAQARPSRAVTPRVSAGRAARRARVRRRLASLPSQVVLGMCLLTLGLLVAVLFLTGEVKLGFAP